jgi:hypothetical protein
MKCFQNTTFRTNSFENEIVLNWNTVTKFFIELEIIWLRKHKQKSNFEYYLFPSCSSVLCCESVIHIFSFEWSLPMNESEKPGQVDDLNVRSFRSSPSFLIKNTIIYIFNKTMIIFYSNDLKAFFFNCRARFLFRIANLLKKKEHETKC